MCEAICKGNNERLVVIKYDDNRAREHQVYFYYNFILYSSLCLQQQLGEHEPEGAQKEEDENDEVKSIIKFYESEIKASCATKITFCISNMSRATKRCFCKQGRLNTCRDSTTALRKHLCETRVENWRFECKDKSEEHRPCKWRVELSALVLFDMITERTGESWAAHTRFSK